MQTIIIYAKGQQYDCLVDDDDYGYVCSLGAVNLDSKGYAQVYIRGSHPYRTARVARVIMARYENIEGKMVDHRNHNKLDNRRENLRICSQSQNNANSIKKKSGCRSRYKGVCVGRDGKWSVRIVRPDGSRWNLGTFETELDAAIAYDLYAPIVYGEFSAVNGICISSTDEKRIRCIVNSPQRAKERGCISLYKGVRHKGNRYYAVITQRDEKGKHRYSLGGYATEKEAAIAYNHKALELYGPWARLNEVDL